MSSNHKIRSQVRSFDSCCTPRRSRSGSGLVFLDTQLEKMHAVICKVAFVPPIRVRDASTFVGICVRMLEDHGGVLEHEHLYKEFKSA